MKKRNIFVRIIQIVFVVFLVLFLSIIISCFSTINHTGNYDNKKYDKSCITDKDCILYDRGGLCGSNTCINKKKIEENKLLLSQKGMIKFVGATSCFPSPVACRCHQNRCTEIEYHDPNEFEDCKYVEVGYQQVRCYYALASKNNNDSLCNGISDLRNQIICKNKLAIEKSNLGFCKETGLLKDNCIFRIAHSNHTIVNELLAEKFPFEDEQIINETSLFYVFDEFNSHFNMFNQNTDPFKRKQYLRHVLLKDEKKYLHSMSFNKGEFMYGEELRKKINSQLMTLKSHNNYNSSFFRNEKSAWGTFLLSKDYSRALFQFFNGARLKQSNIMILFSNEEKPNKIEFNKAEVSFCKEMYNFSFFISGYDLISFYRDECIYDVAITSSSLKACKHIEDTTIQEICYESLKSVS